MIITSKMALPLTVYRVKGGKEIREVIMLRPGKHNYPSVNHKDPRVAEQLRVMRKHTSKNGVWFDELLPSDVELMGTLKGTPEDKAVALKAAVTLGPKKLSRKAMKHASGTGTNETRVRETGKNDSPSKGRRKVSNKSAD